jgi:hypothetical protein
MIARMTQKMRARRRNATTNALFDWFVSALIVARG